MSNNKLVVIKFTVTYVLPEIYSTNGKKMEKRRTKKRFKRRKKIGSRVN